jgi:hypothetical protein
MQRELAAPPEEVIKRIITQSLISSEPVFILSACSTDELTAVHTALDTAWEDLRGQHRQKVVRDLSVTRFTLPWSEHPALAFYHRCIEQMSLDQPNADIRLALREGGYASENALIQEVLHFLAFGSAHRSSIVNWGGDKMALLPSYLTDSCSQIELRRLALARNLTTEERFMLLQCIWECQRGTDEDQAIDKHTRLWLSVDKLENLLDYSPKERRDLAQGLEYLIASTSSFLTVWLNISEPDPDVLVRVKEGLGSKLWHWLDEDLTERPEG